RITPIAECALGELHDVSLVNQRHAFALVLDRVLNRRANQSFRSNPADWFESDAHLHLAPIFSSGRVLPARDRALSSKADLFELFGKFLAQEVQNFLSLGRPSGVFNSRIDILAVLADDHLPDLLVML